MKMTQTTKGTEVGRGETMAERLRRYKQKPARCECGKRGKVYKSDGWCCARCAELESIERKREAWARKRARRFAEWRFGVAGAWETAFRCTLNYQRY